MTFRIGHGYDVHRLAAGRPLIMGGVEIAYPFGLDGHSDADVILHAVMDALLGALALGDIGHHFPTNDARYAGADSMELLADVWQKVQAEGVTGLVNLDVSVLCEKPRLAPHIPQMRENIAGVLGADPGRISLKATTNEGLGFVGRGEGIAAHAVCLLAWNG